MQQILGEAKNGQSLEWNENSCLRESQVLKPKRQNMGKGGQKQQRNPEPQK